MTDLSVDHPTGAEGGPSFDDLLSARYGRRSVLKALTIGGAAAATGVAVSATDAGAAGPYASGEPAFDAVTLTGADAITLPPEFTYDVLLSWGDPVVPGAPAFDITNQTKAAQEMQCGFNHDYIDYRPLPAWNSTSSESGLLFVNHEYTDSKMMFPSFTASPAQTDVELAAHGASIVEVSRNSSGVVSYNPSSSYNRRITGTTPMTLTGPVAGDNRVKTADDPSGTSVLGMLNNCGGGNTPWGTILTCEENFDQYFGQKAGMPAGYALSVANESWSFATGESGRKWENNVARFNMTTTPNETLRFGYVVEIDPYDPASTPKKRTAMGRFKHEAAAGTLAGNGRFVSYSGDDQNNQYIYKFVTAGSFNSSNRAANMDLLDDGTLYVAKFNADGTGVWMPITFGNGPLVAPTFDGQADVLMRTRKAATLLGATKMSRPEDIEVNPVTKKVYAVMTGNSGGEVNAANPRAGGSSIAGQGLGHVIEISEAGGDQTALTFNWEVILLCGQPQQVGSIATPSQPAALNSATDNVTWWAGYDETKVSPIARVDNVSFDHSGTMYLSTDGQPSALQTGLDALNDSLVAFPTIGAERGHGKALMCSVKGCEVTGPFFSPDDKTLFVSIQHPGVDNYSWTSPTTPPGFTEGTYSAPGSSWNVTGPTNVPRPATIVIRRIDGTNITFGESGPPADIPEFPLPIAAAGIAAAVGGLVYLRNRRADEGSAASPAV